MIKVIPLILAVVSTPLMAGEIKPSEAKGTTFYCGSVGGQEETRHNYQVPNGKSSYIKIDCETSTEVMEAGLDKRSSLDSVQQALFMSHLTGKKPVVVIYDTDGVFGIYEFRIKTSAQLAGVEFRNPTYMEVAQ